MPASTLRVGGDARSLVPDPPPCPNCDGAGCLGCLPPEPKPMSVREEAEEFLRRYAPIAPEPLPVTPEGLRQRAGYVADVTGERDTFLDACAEAWEDQIEENPQASDDRFSRWRDRALVAEAQVAALHGIIATYLWEVFSAETS